MNQINLGDPATQAGTPFNLLMPDNSGGIISIINESAYGLDFTIASSTFRVPADTKRDIIVNGTISTPVNWRIANNTNAAVAPVSEVIVECYGLDECPASSIQPLMRQTNVGNSQPVSTQVSQVQNDGNTAPTLVVEGTPAGATGSQLKWNNDGSGLFGGGNASVDNTGKFTLPAGAVPVASIASGALPAGVTVAESQVSSGYPAASLGSGTVPAGVTVPATQIGGGTLPSGVSLPGSQVSGAVANATNATNATNASNVPASGVSGGTFPNTANNAYKFSGYLTVGGISFVGGGGSSGIAQINGSGSATVNTGIGGLQAVVVNTYNGSNSTTYGSGSYTSSTCYVYQYNPQPWVGLVFNG